MSQSVPPRIISDHTTFSPDQALPVITAIHDGLIPDDSHETLNELRETGHVVLDFIYKLTSDSRHPVTVPIICANEKVAHRRPHIMVQTLGLAAGRRQVQAPWYLWESRAHRTVRINGDGLYIPGPVEDGRWREYVNGSPDHVREWVLEYSHGEFTARRLADAIRAHGRRPQLWMTPSKAHAGKIRRVLVEVLPGYPHIRVMVVNWTGGLHALP